MIITWLLGLIIGIVGSAISFNITNNFWQSLIFFIGTSLMSACFVGLIKEIKNFKYGILLYFKALKLSNKRIRISFSYLYIIKINGKYLLVFNDKYKKFTPVGGVYKYFSSAEPKLLEFGKGDDLSNLPHSKIRENDFRFTIKGKKLLSFLKWYKQGIDREISSNREFYEELVKTGILTKENFSTIMYKKIKTHVNGINYCKHFNCEELLIADIVELVMNDSQRVEIEKLLENGNEKIKFATAEEIEKLGCSGENTIENIGRNSCWLL